MPALILASTSPFRQALLARLGLAFKTAAPGVDETPRDDEGPVALAERLARAKAEAVAAVRPNAVVIGADQVAECEGRLLGKPGHHAQAVTQLRWISGRQVTFYTALAVSSPDSPAIPEVVPVTVTFRVLSSAQIEHYLAREPAYDCAGAFKSEGLGIALVESMDCPDPTALVGLPLIRLTALLAEQGLAVP